MISNTKQIEDFWSENPCDSDRSNEKERKLYFSNIEEWRYKSINYIIEDANFNGYNGLKVLEIGCGIGTDGRQFTKNGAIYNGINIDQGSVDIAREAFNIFRLKGGDINKMNAENMKFEHNTFDHIYSYGVIHHTTNPSKIVSEIYRVLKPGGTFFVMLYNKSSINYYLEIMFIRKIFRYMLIPSFAPKLFSKLTGFSEIKLIKHRKIMLEEKMSPEKWISINTDGPDCPLSRVYSKSEAIKLFEEVGFNNIDTFVRFFNRDHYSYLGKLIPKKIADYIGSYYGWHRIVKGEKPK